MENRKIRLLHVVNRFGVGGSERQQVQLIKRLPRERYHQTVATMVREGCFLRGVEECGIEVFEFPTTSFYNLNALRQYRALARVIKQQRIELVHCHDFYSNLFGSLAARLAGRKKLITCRRNMGVMFTLTQRLGQRLAYALSAAIIANSDAAKQIMVTREHVPPGKIHCIYNGIDTDYFSPREPSAELAESLGFPNGTPVVGIVGRLHPDKGQDMFIRAAARIHEARPDVRFLIVGEGPARSEFQGLARDLGMAEAIVFAGDREDVPDLLALMDVFVLTSLAESLPNAVLEAMACERPVVATNVGGVPELVTEGETGWLVPAGDPEIIAERVLRVIGDGELASKMGAVARQRVLDEFSSQRLVEKVEAVYAAVLGCNETIPAAE